MKVLNILYIGGIDIALNNCTAELEKLEHQM